MSISPEKILVYEIREHIAQLPEPLRVECETVATELRARLKDNAAATLAFALVGAELQCDA